MTARDLLEVVFFAFCCSHHLFQNKVQALRAAPASGALQLDAYGRPVHLAAPGQAWRVQPMNPLPASPYLTVAPYEPNLYYGTLQLKDGTVLDRSANLPPLQTPQPTSAQIPVAAPPVTRAEGAATEVSTPPKAPRISGGQPAPPGLPPASPPLLPMQPLAVGAIPVFNPSSGTTAIGAQIGGFLGSLRRSGIEPSKLPGFSFPMLNLNLPWALKQTLEEQAAGSNAMTFEDSNCERDYSLQCPSGWKPKGAPDCEAPEDYPGGCPHLLRIEFADADRKRRIEMECKVLWPCLRDRCDQLGGRDYSAECPMNWVYTGKCLAPTTYKGHCEAVQDLSGFTEKQKADFSVACQTEWPCQNESCESDYTNTCPMYWRFDVQRGSCEPPKNYKGSFRDNGELKEMAPSERAALAARWEIVWPCVSEAHENSCLRDYAGASCPRGWFNAMNSGVCQAPLGYAATHECPKTRHFDFLSIEKKKELEEACDLEWPCLGQAPEDCSQCPKGWVRAQNRFGWCEPGASYTGPCRGAQNWDSMSLGQKNMLKRACEVNCPMAEIREAEAGFPRTARASILVEGTAAGRYHTLE